MDEKNEKGRRTQSSSTLEEKALNALFIKGFNQISVVLKNLRTAQFHRRCEKPIINGPRFTRDRNNARDTVLRNVTSRMTDALNHGALHIMIALRNKR